MSQSDGSVVVDVLLDDEQAKKYWESFSSYMEMSTKQLEKKLSASAKRIAEMQDEYSELSNKIQDAINKKEQYAVTSQIYEEEIEKIKEIQNAIDELNAKRQDIQDLKGYGSIDESTGKKTLSHEEYEQRERDLKLIDKQIEQLENEKQKEEQILNELYEETEIYNEQIEKIQQLTAERENISAELQKENEQFSEMNAKYISMNDNNKEIANTTKNIEKHTNKIKGHTNNINNNLKSGVNRLASGLKKILRMSLALIGIRSIYTGISTAIRIWLNSEDEVAQKIKANLENLRLNFANMLKPALQYVVNALNNALAIVGAVVKQFANLNIFAKQTAKSTKETSKNASNTLASFDKIDVLQKDTGADDNANVEPVDMESLMNKYEDLAKKIKELMETLFVPFQKAWQEKGQTIIDDIKSSFQSIAELGKVIASSIFNVWTNGTIEETAKTLLNIFDDIVRIIGNVAEAWKNAWAEDDKGTKIIQNIADALNSVVKIIQNIFDMWEKVTASEGYQKFINALTKGFEVISQGVKFIAETWQKMVKKYGDKWAENFNDILGSLGETLEGIASIVENILKNEEFRKIFEDYVDLIGRAVNVLTDWWKILADILALIVNPDWEHLDKIKEDIEEIVQDALGEDNVNAIEDSNWLDFDTLAGTIEEKIGDIEYNLSDFNDWIDEHFISPVETQFQNFENWIESMWENITENFPKKAEEMATNVKKKFEELKKELPKKVNDIKEAIGKKWQEIKEVVKIKVDEMRKSINDRFDQWKGNLSTRVNNIKEEIGKKWQEIKEIVKIKVDEMKSAINNRFDQWKDNLSTRVNNIKKELDKKWQEVKEIVKIKVDEMKSAINNRFDQWKGNLATRVNNIKEVVGGKWQEIKEVVKRKVDEMRNSVGEKFDIWKQTLSDKVGNIKRTLTDKWEEVKQAIGNKVQEVVSNVTTPFEGLGDTLKGILDKVWEKIKAPLNTLIEGFNNMLNRISKTLNDIIWRVNNVINNNAIQKVAGWTGLGGKSIPYFDDNIWIPRLATGGIVTHTTPAIIGEAGAEAVIPLERNTEWLDMLAERLNSNFVCKFEGNLSQLGKILKPVIERENRRVGTSLIVGKGGV